MNNQELLWEKSIEILKDSLSTDILEKYGEAHVEKLPEAPAARDTPPAEETPPSDQPKAEEPPTEEPPAEKAEEPPTEPSTEKTEEPPKEAADPE